MQAERITPKSDMPFGVGDLVIERLGFGPDATQEPTRIVFVDGRLCQTAGNRWYDRETGGRVLGSEYRALHSIGYGGEA